MIKYRIHISNKHGKIIFNQEIVSDNAVTALREVPLYLLTEESGTINIYPAPLIDKNNNE